MFTQERESRAHAEKVSAMDQNLSKYVRRGRLNHHAIHAFKNSGVYKKKKKKKSEREHDHMESHHMQGAKPPSHLQIQECEPNQ